MSASEQSQIRTRMFARVMGPFLTIVPTTVAIRSGYMRTLFSEFEANPMWPWLYGAILLISGLIVIAFHQYWRSSAAIIVSLVGWFLALRGLILMTVPQVYNAAGNALVGPGGYNPFVYVLFIVLALAGLYLTYAGWITPRNRPKATSEAAQGPTEDLRYAAGH
jgi:hypothetical protein